MDTSGQGLQVFWQGCSREGGAAVSLQLLRHEKKCFLYPERARYWFLAGLRVPGGMITGPRVPGEGVTNESKEPCHNIAHKQGEPVRGESAP